MMGKSTDTQVIIVGAGPAGAGASFFLSKYGIPHVVIDKETFPRDKVCGDACSGKTALVINRADPEWLNEILDAPQAFTPSWGIKFVAPNGRALDIPFSPKRTPETKAPGFTVPRMVFDDFLFRKMPSPYCTIYQGASITDIERGDNKVTVNMTHNGVAHIVTAPVIIGADGDKSIVHRKFVSDSSQPKAYAVGLRAYYEGVTDMHPDNYIELHFLPEVLPGYLWIFPLPNGMANVGVGLLSEIVREKKINLREQMLHAIKTNPQIAPRFANARLQDKIQGWGLPLATERRPLSGDNYILCGDAASLVDPFSGEGIGNALYSGMLAAMALKEVLPQRDLSAARLRTDYDDVLYKRLGDEFRISATLQRLSKYPWLFNFVVNKAYKSPSLRNTISCMFTDMDLRDQFSKPSFYLKILFNR
ncbi:geranylgeranyl reductase family protein [Nemorincola caseinilytica]|uniref:Geranylgeranyl reductase family protein n=1 Tax=Nemorincola caseinilytica TaxID=2054315 RepID=A0ABP8NNI0_9BACT